MAIISRHTDDWCHVCGKREDELADISYPKNAEHSKKNTEYIRICKNCLINMAFASIGPEEYIVETNKTPNKSLNLTGEKHPAG